MKYKFKNKEDYTNQRNAVYTEAEQALANGDVGRANELMADMEEMDTDYEAYATAQANLNAARNGAQTAGLTGLGVQNSGGTVVETLGAAATERDMLNTREYQEAFMNLVCRGEKMPEKFQDAIASKLTNAVTAVTDTTAVIPNTLLKEIIRELKDCGELYSRVRKVNVRGGVDIPILTLAPTATWVADGAASVDQKLTANTKVSFSYYGLECKIAQTLIANVVDLDEFTEMFVPLAVEAIMSALDKGIIAGTGSGQMTGVAVDDRIPEANVIEMSEDDFGSWEAWKKNVFAKMKKKYRDGIFVMAQGTFDGNIDGMVDLNGQPIARVNYGITDGEKYRFGGKEVLTVEEDVIAAFDSASDGDVVAVFMKPSDYIINTNLQMRVDKWRDNDTNQEKVKVTMVCDGKIADPHGVLIIKKKSNGVNADDPGDSVIDPDDPGDSVIDPDDPGDSVIDAGTFNKNTESEDYQDISVTVAEEGETIDKLLLDGEEVAKNNGANWSVSSGTTVVLKKAYLATFDVGSLVFTAVTSSGSVPFEISIVESEE